LGLSEHNTYIHVIKLNGMNEKTLKTTVWSLMSVLILLVLLVSGNDGPMEVTPLSVMLMVGIVSLTTVVLILLLIVKNGNKHG